MKFFSLFVLGIVAVSFSACEQQPYSKLEIMESPFRHDLPAEKKAEEKDEAKAEGSSETKAEAAPQTAE